MSDPVISVRGKASLEAITGLVEAADAGLLAAEPRQRGFAFSSARTAAAVPAPSSPEFDFEPAKQTVTARVEARFTMTAPSFGT